MYIRQSVLDALLSKESLWYRFVITLKLFCITGFLVQTSVNVKNVFWNRETSVNIRDVKISEMNNFPLVFKLLLRPGYDIMSLEKEGYSDLDFYFHGYSKYGYGRVGWRGHNQDGSVRGDCREVFDRVKYTRNMTRMIKHILIFSADQKIILSDNETSVEIKSPSYPDNEIFVDISRHVNKKNVRSIAFGIAHLTARDLSELEIVLLDRSLTTSRPLSSLNKFRDGQIIIRPG